MDLTLTKGQYEACMEQFKRLGELALKLNHYQLSTNTHIEDPIIWKAFLTDPRTQDYIQSEMTIIRSAAINEIIQQAPNSKSVGQAQLINSLIKIEETAANKDGPVFIYCYVPLNNEQMFAPNVRRMDENGQEIEEDSKYDGWQINENALKAAALSRRRR